MTKHTLGDEHYFGDFDQIESILSAVDLVSDVKLVKNINEHFYFVHWNLSILNYCLENCRWSLLT